MSDISFLAQQVSLFLAPFVPYLIKGGIETGKAAAGKLGELATEKGWEKAQSIWSKLTKHEEVKKAAETVAKIPDDADAQAALRLQIKLALTADTELVLALDKLLTEATEKRTVTAKGNRSVAVGGNVKDSVIITGDNNKVRK